jgi:hypothetical protein
VPDHKVDNLYGEIARQALVAPTPGSGLEHPRSDHRNGLPLWLIDA